MAWTNPKTWVASSPAGAAELNTHLRDNLNALKSPPTDAKNVGAHSTSSTSYVDVDSTNLSVTIETTGGDILVTFSGSGSMAAAGNFGYLTISLDGVDQWTGGITVATVAGYQGMSFAVWLIGVAAGSHTIKLRYKVSGSTLTIIGAGQFAAREAT
jgi:hypothetical protein